MEDCGRWRVSLELEFSDFAVSFSFGSGSLSFWV